MKTLMATLALTAAIAAPAIAEHHEMAKDPATDVHADAAHAVSGTMDKAHDMAKDAAHDAHDMAKDAAHEVKKAY